MLELAFSILYDPDETLNFIAPNKYEVSSVTLPWTAKPSLCLQLEGRSGQNRNIPLKAGAPEGDEGC